MIMGSFVIQDLIYIIVSGVSLERKAYIVVSCVSYFHAFLKVIYILLSSYLGGRYKKIDKKWNWKFLFDESSKIYFSSRRHTILLSPLIDKKWRKIDKTFLEDLDRD